MEQEILQNFKQKLLDEQKHLKNLIKDFNEGGLGVSLSESVDELSVYDQHPADVGSEIFERSKDFTLREDAMIKLQAVDHALKRVNEDCYGVCESCGKNIPVERLEAVPYTTQCVQCRADTEEAGPRINVRPVEEDILEPPFARGNNDATDKNMYDAEDAWQDMEGWQEHAPHSGAGAYYGGSDTDEEPVGFTELIDHVPYEIGDDGVIYESTRGMDDEEAPYERINIGPEHRDSP